MERREVLKKGGSFKKNKNKKRNINVTFVLNDIDLYEQLITTKLI